MLPRIALAVDADLVLCEFLRQALHRAGIAELTQTDSTRAASSLQAGKFDVIFVDLSAAPSRGVELTRRIRTRGPNRATPVILISACENRGALAQGFEAGATFFVHLPVLAERLTQIIVHATAVDAKLRRFRRVAKRLKVVLASTHLRQEGETIDVSLGGMLVRIPRPFPLGAFVEIGLHIPVSAKPVVGMGMVTRSNGSNVVGVRMDRLTIEQSRKLQDYLLPLLVE